MWRAMAGLMLFGIMGCARIVETRGTSEYAPAGEHPGGVVNYPPGARDDALRLMSEHCGGAYEIVRESDRVVGTTGVTTGAVLVGPLTGSGIAFDSSTTQTVRAIEFRCNRVLRAVEVPAINGSSSRAERLRAELRQKQANRESAARKKRDPQGFRGLKWGSTRTAVEAAFPAAKPNPTTGLLELLEPVAGFPASTLLGLAQVGLQFAVVRVQETGSFGAVVTLLNERYGPPDTQTSTEATWKFESTVIRARPEPFGTLIRYESAGLEGARSADL